MAYEVAGGGYNDPFSLMAQNQYQQSALARDRFNQIDIPAWQLQELLGRSGLSGYYDNNWNAVAPGTPGAFRTAPYQQWWTGQSGYMPDDKTPTMGRQAFESGTTGYYNNAPTMQREQAYAQLFSNLRGPQNWAQYQTMMAGMPQGSLGGLSDLFRKQSAWGEVQADPWMPGSSGGTAAVTQPHRISAQDYAKMTPTQKQMQSSEWESQGLDPSDMWARMQRAQPQGQAANTTRWR